MKKPDRDIIDLQPGFKCLVCSGYLWLTKNLYFSG